MKKIIQLAGVLSLNSLTAGTVKIDGDGGPAAVVVKMHADWCPSCKALEPTLAELKSELKDEPVLFLTLDITNPVNTEQSRLLAESLGIENLVKKNNKTGLVLVYDPKTMKTKHVFTKSDDMDTMKDSIMEMADG
ncbi:MAG: thioredoxin family protein [Opitutales bacterium]|jgi:thiol-disulfide isomerase/thioredoxin|nr:thioredoxin family protein [Opitutales bacterium]